jgi:hypothetical protein
MDDEYVFPVRRDQVDMIKVSAAVLRTTRADPLQPGWLEHRALPDGTIVMERSPACNARPGGCGIDDAVVNASLSLCDDGGHAHPVGDGGAR